MILLNKADLGVAGLFGLGSQVGGILLIIVASADKALTPWFYRTAREPDAPRILARTGTHFFLGVLSVSLLVCVFAREIILILADPAFAGAARVVPLIAAGAFLVSAYYYPIKGLMLLKRTGIIPIITGISAVVTIAANLALIPRLGIMGAAAATAIGQLVLFVCTYAVSQRLYPIPYEYGKLGRAFVVGAGMVGLAAVLPPMGLAVSIAVKTAIVATLPIWLLALRVISVQECISLARVATNAAAGFGRKRS